MSRPNNPISEKRAALDLRASGADGTRRREDDGGDDGGAREEAPLLQKRPKPTSIDGESLDMLIKVFTMLAQNRLLPKPGWGLCRSMHQKVHDIDPLLAVALSPVRASVGSVDLGHSDWFDVLFKDVIVLTLREFRGVFTRIPRSLQEVHLVQCDTGRVLPMLRTAVRATGAGFQADALALVHSFTLSDRVASLPDEVGALSAVTVVVLSGCDRLTSLPDGISNLASIGDLAALTALDLSECEGLSRLPDGIGNLVSLVQLNLNACTALTVPPDSIGNLAPSKALDLCYCTLPDAIGALRSLRVLHLAECEALTALPNLPALSQLNLRSCSSLLELPSCLGELVQLTALDLSACSQLASLPNTLGKLAQLKKSTQTGAERLTQSVNALQQRNLAQLSLEVQK
ncbi:hypothetical protein JKP88DRAFT_352405 [Tribonema minus]|uniref:Uncharacterized protein n=1 Tax=Tribonema minus TaxID=303371 RepID=A0A835ZFG8_9STRA|nr:hypothetical protein JKP88DRAFT_352405 [Tribonema minus]